MKGLKNIFKGIAIGVATLVPGVSGGTMAIILGVYDSIIHAISSFSKDWKSNTKLLLEIGFGGILGIALFSRLIENALNKYPHIMSFLFMGIIIGGLPVLYGKATTYHKRDKKDFLFIILGFVIVLLLSAEPTATTTMATSQGMTSMIFLFVAGIIMAIALILPGISGSFMLLVLGLYNVTLSAINDFNIPFLIPFGLGIVVGTLATTKLIESFLQKYPSKAYMLIIGFVLGSLVPVFPGIPSNYQLIPSAIVFIIGIVVMLWLGRKGIVD